MDNEGVKYRISLEDLFSKGIQDAEGHAQGFERRIDTIGEHLGNLKNQLLGAFGVVAGFEFLKGSAEAFVEDERAAQQLKFAVGASGGLASDFKELREQASLLQETGIFDNTDAEKAAQTLLNFGISVDSVKSSMKTFQDVAAVKGTNLDEVVQSVAMASAGGRAFALKQFGLGFIKLEKDMSVAGAEARNFNMVIDAMQKKFSGGLEDITKNTEFGKLAQLKNQFDEFKKDLGKGLMEIFDDALPYLKKFIEQLREMFRWLKENSAMIKALAVGVLTLYASYKIMSVGIGIYNAFLIAQKLATEGLTVAQWLLNSAMIANPIGMIALGIAAAVTAVYAYTKSIEDYKAAVDSQNVTEQEQKKLIADEVGWLKSKTEELVAQKKLSEEAAFMEAKKLASIKLTNDYLEANKKYNRAWADENTAEFARQGKKMQEVKAQLAKLDDKGLLKEIHDLKIVKSVPDAKLGSEIDEPKASKIQNITFNLNQPFQNMKITPQNLGMALEEIAPQFTEFLISLVTDASIVATE